MTADRMDCLFHMAGSSFFPSGPLGQVAGFYLAAARRFPGSWATGDGFFVASPGCSLHTDRYCPCLLVPY